ncbi:hypothetical protein SHKM778_16140 [Streptomyces sp. KM77-8]|uniref:Enoyl reductase (ER) domain-containing protein n=1 Tax=Streptomyces haneummycinicus TaxID=3074435 RepID=A0AAT9HCV2_9ACTN
MSHSGAWFLRRGGEPIVKVMFAVYAARIDRDQPLTGLESGERPAPESRPGWSTVTVKAASLNHHDLWSLRGVGLAEDKLPMILGCDAAGVDEDGNEVVLHSVIGQSGHGVGPREPRSILTERYPGTFAEQVAVPTWNLLPKPKELSFEEAACLPTAWLTAYRMLFTNAGVRPGDSVLVQGPGWCRHRRYRARQGGGAARLRHQPGRGQAQARARTRGRGGRGDRGAAAAAGRRGHRDRGRRHLVPLGEVAAPRRHAGDLRRHQR